MLSKDETVIGSFFFWALVIFGDGWIFFSGMGIKE
jgi:hypothetical protein